jgi:SAM-dependent methyltransferase
VDVDWARISYGHTTISAADITDEMVNAWKSEEIPSRQRALVNTELVSMYQGRVPKVYEVLADALRPYARLRPSTLEIGCASGYYSEVLEYLLDVELRYTGVDYSEPLIRMARSFYPGRSFHVADGAHLPFADRAFEVAVSSGILPHTPNFRDHVAEAARVAEKAVVAHRTPVRRRGPTEIQKKFAYGIETVELLFSEDDILDAFRRTGLDLVAAHAISGSEGEDNYAVTYVFETRRG